MFSRTRRPAQITHFTLCVVLGLSFAQPSRALANDGNNAHNTKPRPVEAGPGGEIKLEKKYRTTAESRYQWHTHLLYESRYITEGRDNLSRNSIYSATSEFTLGDLSIVPWLAVGRNTDYTEFDLNVVYGFKIARDISVYTGYTNIQTMDTGARDHDNELSLDIAYKLIDHVSLLTSIYHAFDASGTFIELATKFARSLNNNLHVSAQAIVGVNSGYIPDGHRGLNNIRLRSTVSYQPATQIEYYAYLSHSHAINREATRYAGDESLGNFTWGGAGLSYRF